MKIIVKGILAGGVVTATVLSSAVLAQQDDSGYLSEEVFFSDIPVVTSASHFPQKRSDAPVSVTIIDRAMIDASAAQQLVDLFKLVPGFQSFYASAGLGTVNYHALPRQFAYHLEVKVDGRSVYEPLVNTVIWQTLGIELEDIDYIEVVRGSNAPSDGLNAFNGSINIVTRKPVGEQQLSLRAEVGERDTRNYSLAYTDSAGPVNYRITAQSLSSDGFPDYEGEPVEDDSETEHVGFRGLWQASSDDQLEFSFGFSDTELGATEGGGDQDALLRWQFDYNYQYINWQHRFSSGDGLELLFYHNDMTINAGKSLGLFSDLFGFKPDLLVAGVADFQVDLAIDDGRSERYEIEGRYRGSVDWGATGRLLQYSVGAASRFDEGESELFFTSTDPVHEESHRAFINLELPLSAALTANGGYLLEHNTTVGTIDAYRVSANYHLDPRNTLRAGYNRSVSAPGLLAANDYRTLHSGDAIFDLDRITNPDLKEQRLDASELAYVGIFERFHLNLELKLFWERYDDLIESLTDKDYPGDRDRRVSYRANTSWLDIDGIEGQLDYRPGSRWLLSLVYSYMEVTGEQQRSINPDNFTDLEDSSSQQQGTLLLSYQFSRGIALSGSYYYQSELDYKSGDFIDDHDRLDLKLAKQFKFGRTDGKLELLLQNAFGSDQAEYREFNQRKSWAFVRGVVNF